MFLRRAAGSDSGGASPEGRPSGLRGPGVVPRRGYQTFFLSGAVALALGVTLLVAGANLSRLTTFVAVYWVLAALVTLRWVGSRPNLVHRPVALAAGVASLVVGLAVVFRALFEALLSGSAFLDFLGATAVVTGVLRLSGLIHDDQLARDRPRRRYRFVVGALEVLLGVTILTAEGGAAQGTRIVLGLWGLAMGTFLVLDGIMVRRRTADAGRAT